MMMAADRSGFLLDGHEEHGDDLRDSRALVRDLMFVTRSRPSSTRSTSRIGPTSTSPTTSRTMWKPFLGNGSRPERRRVLEAPAQAHPARLPQEARRRLRAHDGRTSPNRMLDRWEEGQRQGHAPRAQRARPRGRRRARCSTSTLAKTTPRPFAMPWLTSARYWSRMPTS